MAMMITLIATDASAYRPFDGTDAAVTDPGEFEVELQPAGLLRQGADSFLVSPSTVLNYGFAPGWEVNATAISDTPLGHARSRSNLTADSIFLKGVLRPGSLQGGEGLSIATEFGPLLPGIAPSTGFGADGTVIVSQAWPWGAAHLNLQAQLTAHDHADLFIGTILEGPRDWTVRPVAEIIEDRNIGGPATHSLLVGAIWQLRPSLAFDAALRGAKVDEHSVAEFRLGVTFALDVGVPQ